jgi:tellurite resistance protein TerC
MAAPVPSAGGLGFYILFFFVVLLMVAIDMLALKQSGSQRVSTSQALRWTGLWVMVAVLFGAGLYWWLLRDPAFGAQLAQQKTIEFFTGYVIEKALAVDNIFVFLLIFKFFDVATEQQRGVLLYGVLGAILLRALMIGFGALLVAKFSWLLYLFGAFLLVTGLRMLKHDNSPADLGKNRLLGWLRAHLRITAPRTDDRFMVRQNGLLYVTPLFLCLVMIELSDVVFAVDSIPAIFAITLDPFIVLTSNILAILGLRALYFLLADMIERFHLLSVALALVLCFIGAKMLLVDWLHIPAGWSLLVVFLLLAGGVLLSLLRPQQQH